LGGGGGGGGVGNSITAHTRLTAHIMQRTAHQKQRAKSKPTYLNTAQQQHSTT